MALIEAQACGLPVVAGNGGGVGARGGVRSHGPAGSRGRRRRLCRGDPSSADGHRNCGSGWRAKRRRTRKPSTTCRLRPRASMRCCVGSWRNTGAHRRRAGAGAAMIVAFLRHGATAWNEQGRMQGRRDIPLSERGRGRGSRVALLPHEPAFLRWKRLGVEPAATRGRDGGNPVWRSAAVRAGTDRDGLGRMGRVRLPRIAPAPRRGVCAERGGRARFPAAGRRKSARRARSRRALACRRVATRGETVVAVTHKGVLRAVLAAATGWDMTGKPPLRLRYGALHRFRGRARSDGSPCRNATLRSSRCRRRPDVERERRGPVGPT